MLCANELITTGTEPLKISAVKITAEKNNKTIGLITAEKNNTEIGLFTAEKNDITTGLITAEKNL